MTPQQGTSPGASPGPAETTAPIGGDSGIARIARIDPGRVVLQLPDRSVTYAEVDAAANRLAKRLLDEIAHAPADPGGEGQHRFAAAGANGASDVRQTCVPVLVEDSEALLVAYEAVSRAAMITVPIDPNTPTARIEYITRKVRAPFILSDFAGQDRGSLGGLRLLHPLRDGADDAGQVQLPPGLLGSITFTSGSTGEPKGVMKRAEGSEGLLGVVTSIFGEEPVRLGAVVPGSVPASAQILSLFAGYGWNIVPFEIRRQQGEIGPWLMRAAVRVFVVVPTVLRQVIGSLEPGQIIPGVQFVGIFGETTTWDDVGQLRAHLEPGAIIFNVYAQSEAGDIAMMAVGQDTVIGTGRLPVGKPIQGREIVIVGEDGSPVPDGEEGEIVVRSHSAAAGYWDEDLAESQVFFPQPDGTTVVHTRDRGRIGPGGLLEHLGRIDHMVKIAGNRVDLGEIEATLRSYPWVRDAAATVYTSDNGELRLRAFVVMEPSRIANSRSLRGWLVQRLPRPAVPDIVEVLDELPMLPNGKVDRRALPAHQPRLRTAGDGAEGGGAGAINGSADGRGAALAANSGIPVGREPNAGPVVDIPLPELEATLVRAWGDILGLEDLTPEDDFFDSGGDSLRAVGLVAAVSEELGTEVPLWLLLEHATPRSMASALTSPQVLAPVVTMKSDGHGLPLFVVHDTFGSLFGTRHYLDAVNLDQPIFGIRAAAWEKTAPVEESLVALASHYVDDVCRARPRGAFCLYGQDTAAMIAFELGRQLIERGRTVALLVVGSEITPPKPLQMAVQSRLKALKQLPAERLPSELLDLASHAVRGAATRARRRARGRQSRQALSARGAELAPLPLEERAERARSYYRDLVRSYRPPGKYHGSVLVVTAPWMDKDATVRWSQWVDGPLRISDAAAFLHDLDSGPSRVVESLAP